MYNVLYTGLRRQVSHANFNSHLEGELHPNRIIDSHDLIYIVEGGWEIGQDGRNYLLEQGDVLFLHARHHHYGVKGYAPGVKTMFMHINCYPEEKLVEEIDKNTLDENVLALPTVIKCQNTMSITTLFEDVIFTFWSDSANKNIKLSALIDLLLYNLAISSTKNMSFDNRIVDDVLGLIRLTPSKMFSLSELSEKLNFSSRSLTDKFKKITGKSIHQYQIDLKLEMAFMLIKDNPVRPLKEVAHNLGFYDGFHLSKLFKKKYGYSPSELKKNISRI